jgi:hypothetical protein
MKAHLLSLALVGIGLAGCKEREILANTKAGTMDRIPEGWPTDWEGESLADLGADGKIRCTIILTDGYTPIHLKNYTEIKMRWPEICQRHGR